jgi:hypothetical protein
LESENERLSNALEDNVTAYEDGFQDGASLKGRIENKWVKENQQLKDRIAELEKGNEALSFAVKQGFNDCQAKTLKQFAERLKEMCEYNRKQYCCEATVSANDIDETLKEFVNEELL